MTNQKFVIYKRLSKEESKKTQHGFSSQEFDCKLFLDMQDSPEVVGEFEEFVSGSETVKPQLEKAFELCRESGAKLLIAKTDRLSRRVSLTSAILEGDVQVKVACLPNADNFQINLYALLAESERDFIRSRVKKAMEVIKRDAPEKLAKGKGSKWEKSFTANRANHKSTRNCEAATVAKKPAVRLVEQMLRFSKDTLTMAEIASNLNREGLRTARGNEWNTKGVSRLIKDAGIIYRKKTKHEA